MFVRLHVRVRTYVCECELVVLILLPPLALLHCSVQASVCVSYANFSSVSSPSEIGIGIPEGTGKRF